MRIDDTTTDVRWPRWNEAAARLRVRSVLSAPLLASSQSLAEARRISRQFTEALASRDVIVRATGVLLAQGAASEQDAFATLATAARQADRSVQDMAQVLVAAVVARTTGPAGA